MDNFQFASKEENPHLSTTVSITAYPSTEVLTDLQAGKRSRNIEHNFCNELEILSKDRPSNPSLPYDERRKKWRNKLLHHFFFNRVILICCKTPFFFFLAEITAEQVRPSLTTPAMQQSFPLASYNPQTQLNTSVKTGTHTRPKLSILLIHRAEAEEYFKNLCLTAMCNSSEGKTPKGILFSAVHHCGFVSPTALAAVARHCPAKQRLTICLRSSVWRKQRAFHSHLQEPFQRQLPRTAWKGFRGRKLSQLVAEQARLVLGA